MLCQSCSQPPSRHPKSCLEALRSRARASRHLQAPQIVPRGPQESRRASRTTPSPVLPKQQQDCQELLLASGGSSHCLSCFYASSVTLGPSSLLENASQSQSMRRPTYSTYPLGRSKKLKGRRLGVQKDAKSAAEMESPDVDIAAMSKSSAPWQGNAVRVASGQSARRCNDACDRRAPREDVRYWAPGRAQR